jgi:hypothetical protein
MKLYHSHNLNPRVAVAVACHLKSPFRISTRSPGQIERFRSVNRGPLDFRAKSAATLSR